MKFLLSILAFLLLAPVGAWRWAQAVNGQPAPANKLETLTARNRPALAYDAARQEIVLFGGAAKTKSAPDVWEWQAET